MTRPFLPPPPATPAQGLLARLANWLVQRWPGRILLGTLSVLTLSMVGVSLPEALATVAWVVFAVYAAWAGLKLARFLLRRLLWRIRTKLIVSYLFVAVVPVVLLALFFLLAAALFYGLVAGWLVTSEIDRKAEELGRAAEAAFSSATGAAPSAATIEKALAPAQAIHPELSYRLVWRGSPAASRGAAPEGLPAWWQGRSFSGLVVVGETTRLRAVAAREGSFLVVDVPVDQRLLGELEQRAGVRLLAAGGRVEKRGGEWDIEMREGRSARPQPGSQTQQVTGPVFLATPDAVDWATGAKEPMPLAFQYRPLVLLRHLTPGTFKTTDILVKLLTVVGAVFLVGYGLALLLGLLLARSITRSVHALSRGTERLRRGRFDQPIPVHSRDQLGDLAESFNVMARGIEDLLRESAEKERLEEELRIARKIQMSLLPQDGISMPGVVLAASCLPAAEVGGDYYDLLPLPGDRLAVLVADVSGKGTSAALYMAELKGLMLSLSRVHDSPARLLCEANRILSANLDASSFITVGYAVLDGPARRMRYARAGHSPLIHFEAATARTKVLAPAGLGLGLDGGEQFERVLEEQELALQAGDVFLFFTDGLSEAMNARGELFGEERLRQILEEDGGRGSEEELKERILAEVRLFVGEAPPHDDMTMVVLKVV